MRKNYDSPRLRTALFRETDVIATEGESFEERGANGNSRKLLWILVALLVVAAVILVIVLPRAGEAQKSDPAAALSEEGLPLDTGAANANASGTGASGTEAGPNIDPGTGMELEEDELPILTP